MSIYEQCAENVQGNGGGFNDMIWDGPLSRPQAELLAARVSSINSVFTEPAPVMLLRESSKAVDLCIDTNASMGGEGTETVDHGAELVSFAEAVTRGWVMSMKCGSGVRASWNRWLY